MTRDRRQSGSLGVRIVSACALAVLASAMTGAPMAGAQTPGLQITSVSADNWPALEVTSTVLDASGQPFTGLGPDAFSATIDGEPVAVQGLQTTSDPGVGIAVVLTFDVSGSMQGVPLENARAAGRALVAQLGPSDQAAVIAFSDQPAVVQPFTGDKAALDAAINNLAVGGNTSLYAAVQESVRLADSAPLPRRAVVLLSDGLDFGGLAVDPQAALSSVEAGSAVFMSIGLGNGIDQDYLTRLAAVGRGQFRLAPAPGDLTTLYQETANVLRQQYVLTLDAADIAPARAHGKVLQVRATAGGTVLTGETTLNLPPALLATPVPTAVPPSAPPPQAETEPASESSSSVVPFVVGALAAAAGIAAIGFFLLVRRKRETEEQQASAGLERIEVERMDLENAPLAYPAISRVAQGEPGAWLDTPDRRIPLGENPVTVGFTSDCMVTLINGVGSKTERVRIWLRDGSYMLHNLSRTGTVTIAGRPVTWAVLEDGDEIRIGGTALFFRAARSPSEI